MSKAHVYSDFSDTLEITDSGSVKVLYDEDVIVKSIRAIMATVRGERVRSNFGGSLVRLLFEPIQTGTAEMIKFELRDLIEEYEPRVSVNRVVVNVDYDNNQYDVEILLTILSINRRMRFNTRLRSLADY